MAKNEGSQGPSWMHIGKKYPQPPHVKGCKADWKELGAAEGSLRALRHYTHSDICSSVATGHMILAGC